MLTCTFENGKKASLRHVVADVILIDNTKILLVKRAAHLTNPNKWAIIGGFVDRDEHIEETAKREALEESGYQVTITTLFRINDNPKRKGEDRQNISFIYLAKPLKKVREADIESSETRWFDLDKLPSPDEFAFDHFEQIQLYLKYLKNPFPLPLTKTPIQ